MSTITILLLGVLIGVIFTCVVFRCWMVGALRVDHSDHSDHSDPHDAPYLFLELSKELTSVTNKKYVVLKVLKKNFIGTVETEKRR